MREVECACATINAAAIDGSTAVSELLFECRHLITGDILTIIKDYLGFDITLVDKRRQWPLLALPDVVPLAGVVIFLTADAVGHAVVGFS